MGLDTIAYKEFRNGEHVEADDSWFEGTEELVRGVMGSSLSWIRGKVYAHLVEQISGISLYQESISNDHVRQIAEALEDLNRNPEKFSTMVFYHNFDRKHLRQLERWFRIAADNGCYIHGWY